MERFSKRLIPVLVLSISLISFGSVEAADEVKQTENTEPPAPKAESKASLNEKKDPADIKADENNKQAKQEEEIQNPTVEDLKRFYDSGNYRGVFNLVKKMKPTMMTHYYTGLAYQATNQRYRAAVEYNHVKLHAKDKKLKYNATIALKSLYSRKSKRRRESSYDEQDRLDSYARHPDQTGVSSGFGNNYEALQRAQERAKKRRSNQDRYWNGYKAPRARELK